MGILIFLKIGVASLLVDFSCLGKHVYFVLSCTVGIARRSLGITPGYQSGFIHGILTFKQQICFLMISYHLSVKFKTKWVSILMIWILDLIGTH